jgi:2-polyprenyl-3-methyl-5-hydroxy-6-metoxy-1,4-benzoquinol methylase
MGGAELAHPGVSRAKVDAMNRNAPNSVTSPLVAGPAILVDTLQSSTIVARYAAEGVDVSGYFRDLPAVQVYECETTGYRYFHPPSLAGGSDFYEQLYDPASRVDWVDPEYRLWGEDYQYAVDQIVPGERVLDVGCGYGHFLRRAAEKADVTGIDGSRFAQEQCHKLGLKVELGSVGDYRDKFAAAFDTVCAFQVLEHVYDVRSFIMDLAHLAKPGGRLIIAVPNNEPYIRRFDAYNTWNCPPHHVGLWNRASLEAMAPLFGLTPVGHQYCEVSGRWAVEAYLHARYLLRIKEEIHSHSLLQRLMMLALAPYTVPMSLFRHWRTKGRGTRNVIAMTFEKPQS